MTFRILCVCTGNICRSPTAERLLRHRLADLLGAQASALQVTSAGTGALVGEPIQTHAAALLSDAGVEVAGFTARMLDENVLFDADLVLTMTKRHRSAVATLLPAVLPRLFTLREFARLSAAAAASYDPSSVDEGVEAWARRLVPAAAGKRGLVRAESPEDDDVDDPYGGPAAGYRRPFELIDEATATIARVIATPVAAQ